ncbi:MAG: C25 family cysteine peptidase [Bacteriovoracaceae bacterium]
MLKKISLLSISAILLQACSNNSQEVTKTSRTPASLLASTVTQGVLRPQLQLQDFNLAMAVSPSAVTVCGVTFEEPRYNTNNSEFKVVTKFAKLPLSKLRFPLPDRIELADSGNISKVRSANITNLATFNYVPSKPLFPDIPITKDGITPKMCDELKAYHKEYLARGPASINLSSHVLQNTLSKMNEQKVIENKLLAKVDDRVARPDATRVLIIYDDLYHDEAIELATLKTSLGFRARAVAISSLPGYDAKAPVPADCQGEFYSECYHTWGDPVSGVSQLAVPSLKGFHSQTKIYEQYAKVSYIPGLIRAYIRSAKRSNPLDGVILIGNDKVITPFSITTTKNGHYESTSDISMGHLHTDLFYMFPDLPLTASTKLNHTQISPFMWSCRDPQNKINIRYWCNDDENRHWVTPALSAYRFSPFVPSSRIFSPKYAFGSTFFQNIDPKTVIPVGRIPTQEKILGHKDQAIESYVAKIRRWHKELPNMKNNSIVSHGGSTSDTWIFELADTTGFKATYGANSKIYASEFFVNMSKCPGCVYKSGPAIMNELGDKNRVALLINGHGGHSGVQAPYANGNIASTYTSEYYWAFGGDQVRRNLISSTTHNTLKLWEDDGKLMGHVIANSCDLSNFNLDNEVHKLMQNLDGDANQRSFAEQLLTLDNAGPVNTYLNSDVGWGYSDNYYNQKFMSYVSQAWNNCGTLGDAYRLIAMDITKSTYTGLDWQVYNRQFLGSPLNRIAAPASHCYVDTFNNNTALSL